MSDDKLQARFNNTLLSTGIINVTLTALVALKVGYETYAYRDRSQFFTVYALIALSMGQWLPLLLNQTNNTPGATYPHLNLFALFSCNPSGIMEIWLFCWTYYIGIMDSTNMRVYIDTATKAARWGINGTIWLLTLGMFGANYHFVKVYTGTFEEYKAYLTVSNVWFFWVFIVSLLAFVFICIGLWKLSVIV